MDPQILCWPKCHCEDSVFSIELDGDPWRLVSGSSAWLWAENRLPGGGQAQGAKESSPGRSGVGRK